MTIASSRGDNSGSNVDKLHQPLLPQAQLRANRRNTVCKIPPFL
jgi:hypothetical protein